MKKLLLIATTLFFLALRSNAADATIANAPGGALAAIPDTYRMPWENPGVQGYYSSFSVLTNLILSGIAGTGYVSTYYLPLSGGTLSSGLTNNSVAGFYGNGANLTNVPFYIYTNWAASQINPYNASGLAFAPGYGMLTDWGITAGGIVVRTNGIDTSTVITTNGGSFYGSVFSLSVTTNAPANNELATAGWVRGLFDGSGVSYYATTNIAVGFTNNDTAQVVYSFSTAIPAYIGSRTYTEPANGTYIGSVTTTNKLLQLNSGVTVNAYLESLTGSGTVGPTVKPEIYVSYDGTNWFGDWDSQAQAITEGVTNLYSWTVSNPSYSTTNATGFYVMRRIKVVAQVTPDASDVVFHIGTNSQSHISLSGASAGSGNAYLAANQTFTGVNTYSQTIIGSVSGNAATATTTASATGGTVTNGLATELYVQTQTNGYMKAAAVGAQVGGSNFLTSASALSSNRGYLKGLYPVPPIAWDMYSGTLNQGDVTNFMAMLSTNKMPYSPTVIIEAWQCANTNRGANGLLRLDPARFPDYTLKTLADYGKAIGVNLGIYMEPANAAGVGNDGLAGPTNLVAEITNYLASGITWLRGSMTTNVYNDSLMLRTNALWFGKKPIIYDVIGTTHTLESGYADIYENAVYGSGGVQIQEILGQFSNTVQRIDYVMAHAGQGQPGQYNGFSIINNGMAGATLGSFRAQMGMVAMLSTPMMFASFSLANSNYWSYHPFMFNDEVYEVLQDPLAETCQQLVSSSSDKRIYGKRLGKGVGRYFAVALLNTNAVTTNIVFSPASFGFVGTVVVRDIWNKTNFASMDATASITSAVPGQDLRLLTIRMDSAAAAVTQVYDAVSAVVASGVTGRLIATNLTTDSILRGDGEALSRPQTNANWMFGGAGAVGLFTSGYGNIGLGVGALRQVTSGAGNIGIGSANLQNVTTTAGNTAIGHGAMTLAGDAVTDTALGYGAFGALTTGDYGLALGYTAGNYVTTENGQFYVDTISRGSLAAAKTNSLMYGVFNAASSSQTLDINAALTVKHGIVGSGAGLTNIPVGALAATGITASKFLKGDGTWEVPGGAGGGDLFSTNNLSDVANAGAARTNLAAHNASNLTTGTVAVAASNATGGPVTNGLASQTYVINATNVLWAPARLAAGPEQSKIPAVASGALTWEWVDMTPSTTWATMQALANDKILTNNHAAAVVLGNVAVTSLTNAALTASRMVMSDANLKMVSGAASGAVPVNADGSATTGGQVTNLLTGAASLNAAQLTGTVPLATLAIGATNDNLARKISTTYAPLAGTNDWTGTNDFKNQVKVDATKGIIIGTSVLTNVPGTLYLSGNLNMAGGDLAADSFVGNGGDLTALDASQLTGGTVPTNRLAALIGANTTGNAGTATLATLAIGATNDDLGRKISTTYITAAAANYTNAQFTPYQLLSGSVTIYPTNGNLQRYVITNASTITIAGATTNYVESLRLSIHGSNTITWAGTLSNASVGTCTVAVTELLLDHSENTNLWWMYRLR